MKTNKQYNILSPMDWIKNVQGKNHLEYLDEEHISLDWIIQLMEWYGEYVARKVKEGEHALKKL